MLSMIFHLSFKVKREEGGRKLYTVAPTKKLDINLFYSNYKFKPSYKH